MSTLSEASPIKLFVEFTRLNVRLIESYSRRGMACALSSCNASSVTSRPFLDNSATTSSNSETLTTFAFLSLISDIMALRASSELCAWSSRERTLRSASRAEDWMVRPRDLKMRVVRFRLLTVEFMILLKLTFFLAASGSHCCVLPWNFVRGSSLLAGLM